VWLFTTLAISTSSDIATEGAKIGGVTSVSALFAHNTVASVSTICSAVADDSYEEILRAQRFAKILSLAGK
jgi:hypothetical protein